MRHLAVISRRGARRALIEAAGFGILAERLGRPRLPIIGTRKRGRVFCNLRAARKERFGFGRIVQETKRDPAGGEELLDAATLLFRKRCVARDLEGGLRVAEIE